MVKKLHAFQAGYINELEELGWQVMVIWECKVMNSTDNELALSFKKINANKQ